MRPTRKLALFTDSGITEFVTGDTATETVTPLTGAMRSAEWKNFTLSTWFRALVTAKGRVGVQFSNHPNEFTDTPRAVFTTYITANGWTRDDTVYDLFAIASATPRLYFRFVLLGLTTTGALAGSGQVRIKATPVPLKVVHNLASRYIKANTAASDSASAKHPAIDPISSDGITEHRLTVELAAITGPVKLQVICEESNVPDDVTSWSTVATIGAELTATGTTFPTTFASVSITKRFVRYVVGLKNDTGGTDVEYVIVRIAVEARG